MRFGEFNTHGIFLIQWVKGKGGVTYLNPLRLVIAEQGRRFIVK